MNTNVTVILLILCILLAISNLLILLPRRKKQPAQQRDYIRQPRMKILWNPFTEAWTWTRLDPISHHWEWRREATTAELSRYMIDSGTDSEPPNHIVFFKNDGIDPSEVEIDG